MNLFLSRTSRAARMSALFISLVSPAHPAQNELLNLDAGLVRAWMAARAAPAVSPATGLFTDVHVVDLAAGSVRMSRAVHFKEGQWVGEYAPETAPTDKYDSQSLKGAYMMSGWVDSHVHIAEFLLDAMPLFTKYGVTHVVNLSGSNGHLVLSREVAASANNLPHVDTSGLFLQVEGTMDGRAACDILNLLIHGLYGAANPYRADRSAEEA